MEADHTGGQSKYSLLPPVTVPHRSTPPPPALSHSPVTSSGRRSVSAPLPLSDNALPLRSSLLHPPPRTSLLPTAAFADNQHTPRYSLLTRAHVGLSPDVAPSAPPQSSTIPVKKDSRYRTRWSYYLICPRPNAGKLCDPLSGWSTPQMGGMHPITIISWDPGLCRAQLAPNATFTPSRLLARGTSLPVFPLSITRPAITDYGTLTCGLFVRQNGALVAK